MAKTKRLTPAQMCALKVLTQGKANYYEIARAGANGKTIAFLVGAGLATEARDSEGDREWQITPAGKTAFETGRVAIGGEG